MMKKVYLVAALFVVVLLGTAHETGAAPCDVSDAARLSICLPAISWGMKPTQACCNGLKEQKDCFCEYMKNPQYKPIIDSAGTRKVASECDVPIPTCD